MRLVGDDGQPVSDGEPGEIQVKSAAVFKAYWNRPDATKEAFTPDGWFRTGDVAYQQNDIYSILGRKNIDIIKTWGQRVCAAVIATKVETLSLRLWATERLAPYKISSKIVIVADLPKNALGKPIKSDVAKMFYPNTNV